MKADVRVDLQTGAADWNIAEFEQQAAAAAAMLKLLANEKRLLILCRLVGGAEVSVGELAIRVGLSQSALSQHLARMREEGLVATRRESQTIYYRLADPRASALLTKLKDIYCA